MKKLNLADFKSQQVRTTDLSQVTGGSTWTQGSESGIDWHDPETGCSNYSDNSCYCPGSGFQRGCQIVAISD